LRATPFPLRKKWSQWEFALSIEDRFGKNGRGASARYLQQQVWEGRRGREGGAGESLALLASLWSSSASALGQHREESTRNPQIRKVRKFP